MKPILLCYVCSGAILLLSLQPLQSQVPGNPRLQKNPKEVPAIQKQEKLSPLLKQLFESKRTTDVNSRTKPSIPISNALDSVLQITGENVLVDITVPGGVSDVRTDVEKIGGKIVAHFGRVVTATIPIKSLSLLEQSPRVKFVRPAFKARHNGYKDPKIPASVFSPAKTTVYSQGDTAQGSALARTKFNVSGKGVKVGILSDSYNFLGGEQVGVVNGELPGHGNPYNRKKPVQVLLDFDEYGSDEGRAMAEIVHDVAPGAQIAFHTAFVSQASFAQGIVALEKDGCNVIVDDVYYGEEPYFQDGIIAQAIEKVTKKGAAYFSIAGNSNRRSYESNYRPSDFFPFGVTNGSAHNFSGVPGAPTYYQPIYIPAGAMFSTIFQWDQPFFSAGGKGSESDLDIWLLNDQGVPVAGSLSDNVGSGDPVEWVFYVNNTSSTIFYIAITKYSGPDPTRLKYILHDQGQFFNTVPVIPGQLAPTIVGHQNAVSAITIAAAPFDFTPAYGVDTPRVENFSSLGGVSIYFDKVGNRITPELRKKPDFTAPDGANTSFFTADVPWDTDLFPNFFGTSASAPHAAGVAALMIEAQRLKTITPDQIRGIMSSKTYDMDNIYTPGFDKGFDYLTGTGLIRAEQAVEMVRFPNLYIKNLKLISLCSDNPATYRNWKIVNPNNFGVDAHWFLTGFSDNDRLTVAPGETYFTTKTGYFQNRPVPNIVVLDWEDNYGFTRFDIASATSAVCTDDPAVQSVARSQTEKIVIEEPVKPEIAEVFPNPSTSRFRLYLSLNRPERVEITLLSVDGKLLYRKTVAGNGIYDIEASGYKPGMYLMKIRQGNFEKVLKLVKQ
jgi:hypothetical protein